MNWVARLRERWGGQLRPSVRCYTERELIERWDICGSGPGAAVIFEGFGLSFSLFCGLTPRKQRDVNPHLSGDRQ